MIIIDINKIEQNSYNNEAAFSEFKDALKRIANGNQLALIKYSNDEDRQICLAVAPMSIVKIEINT